MSKVFQFDPVYNGITKSIWGVNLLENKVSVLCSVQEILSILLQHYILEEARSSGDQPFQLSMSQSHTNMLQLETLRFFPKDLFMFQDFFFSRIDL